MLLLLRQASAADEDGAEIKFACISAVDRNHHGLAIVFRRPARPL